MNPGPVLVRRFARNSKYEPIVEQAQLVDANPDYARIKYADGKESLVSVRHLAAPPEVIPSDDPVVISPSPALTLAPTENDHPLTANELNSPTPHVAQSDHQTCSPDHTLLRRSFRNKKPPSYLKDYV